MRIINSSILIVVVLLLSTYMASTAQVGSSSLDSGPLGSAGVLPLLPGSLALGGVIEGWPGRPCETVIMMKGYTSTSLDGHSISSPATHTHTHAH